MTDLPAGWEWATLGELTDNLDSRRIPVSSTERARIPGDVPYYGATGQVGWINRELFDEDLILLGEDGVKFFDWNRKKSYLVSGPAWVNNHAHVLRARIDRQYLCHYLNLFDYRGYVNGTTRLKLTKSAMDSIPVKVPPLAEQRRIVAALEDHLDVLTRGVRALDHAQSALPALIGSVRDAEVCGDRPDLSTGWRRGRLGDILADIEAGKSFTCEARPARPDEWGIVKVSAMTWGDFRESENKAVPDSRSIDHRYEIRTGDILVSRANTPAYVGAPVLVRDVRPRLLLSDKSLRLKPLPGIDREWLIQVLSAPATRRQITAKATGTKDSMRNISQQSLLAVEIPIAPPDAQVRIGARVRELLAVADRLRNELTRLNQRAGSLRRSLLTEAFAGRLVPQDPGDEPAAELLARIRAGRAAEPKRRTRRAAQPVQKETLL